MAIRYEKVSDTMMKEIIEQPSKESILTVSGLKERVSYLERHLANINASHQVTCDSISAEIAGLRAKIDKAVELGIEGTVDQPPE